LTFSRGDGTRAGAELVDVVGPVPVAPGTLARTLAPVRVAVDDVDDVDDVAATPPGFTDVVVRVDGFFLVPVPLRVFVVIATPPPPCT
jgi:hypothetical protein